MRQFLTSALAVAPHPRAPLTLPKTSLAHETNPPLLGSQYTTSLCFNFGSARPLRALFLWLPARMPPPNSLRTRPPLLLMCFPCRWCNTPLGLRCCQPRCSTSHWRRYVRLSGVPFPRCARADACTEGSGQGAVLASRGQQGLVGAKKRELQACAWHSTLVGSVDGARKVFGDTRPGMRCRGGGHAGGSSAAGATGSACAVRGCSCRRGSAGKEAVVRAAVSHDLEVPAQPAVAHHGRCRRGRGQQATRFSTHARNSMTCAVGCKASCRQV